MASTPVVCPTCATVYDALTLAPGTAFACGQCGQTLITPVPPPVIQPVSSAPVVEPVVEAIADGIAAEPTPIIEPIAPAETPLVIQPVAPAEAAPVIQPASLPQRSMAQNLARNEERSGDFSNRKRLAIGLLVVLLAVLTWAILGSSDPEPTAKDRTAAYVAGYLASEAAELRKALEFAPGGGWALSRFREDHRGLVSEADFRAGYADGLAGEEPRDGSDRIRKDRYDVGPLLDLTGGARAPKSADAAYSASTVFLACASKWRAAGARESSLAGLENESARLVLEALRLDPDHGPSRKLRGETKYDGGLKGFFGAEYLTRALLDRLQESHEEALAVAKENGGWITAESTEKIASVRDAVTPLHTAYLTMMEPPFGPAALETRRDIEAHLDEVNEKAREMAKARRVMLEKFKDSATRGIFRSSFFRTQIEDREFHVKIGKPYVVFVEVRETWDPVQVAEQDVLGPLLGLDRAFRAEYQKKYALADLDDPLAVLYLRDGESYSQYQFAGGGFSTFLNFWNAHYDAHQNLLVLNGDTRTSTRFHEAAYQLLQVYSKVDTKLQSVWFQQGIANWFAGAGRSFDKVEKRWNYTLGRLNEDAIKTLGGWLKVKQQLTLEQLLAYKPDKKATVEWKLGLGWRQELVAAQGCYLIHFLRDFDVDDEGLVKIGTDATPVIGRYRAGWERYQGFELQGVDGKPHIGKAAFMGALALDDPGFQRLAKEYDAYLEFIVRKQVLRQIQGKRLIPWHDYVNKRGEKAGTKDDDRLKKK
ncbi:MAG: hypothetical protein CL908_09075 [Deltaproteobacteria bacterium]|nr:hypothetical protein [Deltaproteobacteria bacterium]